ncbi:MAG: NifU family protein [Haloferacaceae archaeon]
MTDADDADDAGATLADRVEEWLAAQMAIIRSHGGTSAVRAADPATGEVVIELGGSCAGCGVSDMTARRIERDLRADVAGVESVSVRVPSGGDGGEATVEGGRGGDVRVASEPAEHF